MSTQRTVPLPKSPERQMIQSALLQHRRVAKALHGRSPIEHEQLVEIIAGQFSISRGAAAAAIQRAVDAGHVTLLVVLGAEEEDEALPAACAVVAALEDDVRRLAEEQRRAQRREAGMGAERTRPPRGAGASRARRAG